MASVDRNMNDAQVFVDVSPLWELQYTGISNVVHELAQRFLADTQLQPEFLVMGKSVPTDAVATCVAQKRGTALHEIFAQNIPRDVPVDDRGYVNGRPTVGFFSNTKPSRRVFCHDTQLFYDFSPLLTPECHTPDTVRHHMTGLGDQINSNSLLFCISESTAGDLVEIFKVERSRLRVALLGNNVDLSFSRAIRKSLRSAGVESFFLVLGTIEPRKNIPFVLDWIRTHPELLERHKFVFAGREGWGPTFAELVAAARLEPALESGRIVHLGFVDEWAKAALLAGAEALIFPSVFEGFGLPILEAMSVGTIVISSVSTSLPEVLGNTGYYFDPYSLDSLHRAYRDYLLDREAGVLPLLRNRAFEQAATFSYDHTYAVIRDGLSALVSNL